jgi:uncharacterized ParB-like nuclease family protein
MKGGITPNTLDLVGFLPAGRVFKGGITKIGRGKTSCKVGELVATHPPTMSKRAFRKLKDDIRKNGIKEPILYVEHNGEKYIVDGHHRVKAAKQLNIDKIPAKKVKLPFRGYKNAQDLTDSF